MTREIRAFRRVEVVMPDELVDRDLVRVTHAGDGDVLVRGATKIAGMHRGDGTQTRSFCFVTDEAAGLIALLESDHRGPMNIGNPGEFTILELAEMVLEVTGADVPIVTKMAVRTIAKAPRNRANSLE